MMFRETKKHQQKFEIRFMIFSVSQILIICIVFLYIFLSSNGLFIDQSRNRNNQQITSILQAPELNNQKNPSILHTQDPIISPGDYWENRLYTPTQMVKLSDKYFIVDCWQHRIIWSYNPSMPIQLWNTLDDTLSGPHSIAFNGEYFAVDDTGKNGVAFYRFLEDEFIKVQYLDNIGVRPHHIVYDTNRNAFYVVAANSVEMYKIQFTEDKVFKVTEKWSLQKFDGKYLRSFTIIGDKIYFGTGGHIVVTTNDDTFKVLAKYPLPEDFIDLNDIYFNGKSFIITSTYGIGMIDEIKNIGEIKNQIKDLGIIGYPYFVSMYDSDSIIIPEIRPYSAIKVYNKFDLSLEKVLFDFGPPTESSLSRINESKL